MFLEDAIAPPGSHPFASRTGKLNLRCGSTSTSSPGYRRTPPCPLPSNRAVTRRAITFSKGLIRHAQDQRTGENRLRYKNFHRPPHPTLSCISNSLCNDAIRISSKPRRWWRRVKGTLQSRSDCRACTHRLRLVSRRCVGLYCPPPVEPGG